VPLTVVKEILDDHRPHWEKTFSTKSDMFGEQASDPARKALDLFKNEGVTKILELGGGQGRDTFFSLKMGLRSLSWITRRAESRP
jgi:hypothetical protein